jgi:outer membrane immunogenic protein
MSEIKLAAAAAIAGLLAIVSAGVASAADVGAVPSGKAPGYIVPAYDWSGAYIGLNVGYGLGRSSDTAVLGAPSLFTDSAGLTMNGVTGGAQIGYNLQRQNWVVGIETDLQGGNQKSIHSFTCPAGTCTSVLVQQFFIFPGPAVSVTSSQQLDLFGTIRGRAGVAVVPEVLLYATGGFAYGQVHSESNLAGAVRQQNINPGWTIGAGVEGALGGGWSVRLEYLYFDIGKANGVFTSNVLALGGTSNLVEGFSSHVTDNIVRIGLNYNFSGPAILKY